MRDKNGFKVGQVIPVEESTYGHAFVIDFIEGDRYFTTWLDGEDAGEGEVKVYEEDEWKWTRNQSAPW